MTPTTKPSWANTGHWPTCHTSQSAAGLPGGPLEERAPAPLTNWQHFCFGVLMGMLVFGPALVDLLEAAR